MQRAEVLGQHPFETRPHRTLIGLSLPVMLSLIAEPLAGLVDTAFVERLGAASAAALGAATALLSSVLWIFNFLGVGTQTEVARALGVGRREEGREVVSLAMGLALILGCAAAAVAGWLLEPAARFMSDSAEVREQTAGYLRIRLLGFPPTLLIMAAFGALRGLQDMRTPLWIAAAITVSNIVLDAVLVFGWGPVPALGIAGAAWATTLSQLGGAAWALSAAGGRLGWSANFQWGRAWSLLRVGRDMVLRTAALLLFLLVATRAALQSGVAAGAAHQAMRQIWMLLAFMLDAYAATAQSLVGYFAGAERTALARRVAGVSVAWGLGSGAVLALALYLGEPLVALLLVPPESRAAFSAAWPACALAQPANAISFVTDGIHWGTRDYAYLRNAMLLSSAVGIGGLLLIEPRAEDALVRIWWITAGWIALRGAAGWLRVWPGIGRSRLG